MKIRVIPIILVRNFGVVKTIQFGTFRPLGVATNFARVYNSRGVDELIVLDIDATREGRGPDLETIRDISEECFMPLAYGGGIKNLDHVTSIIQNGADKVVVNTEAVRRPEIITEISKAFGAQCVVLSIDAKKTDRGYEVFTHGGTQSTGLDAVAWAKKAESLGAGEICLNSIDQDGVMKGYDVELVKRVSSAVHIPMMAAGGAGELDHFVSVVKQGQASAVCCSSIFHYTQTTPYAIKEHMNKNGLDVRLF